MKRDSAIDLFKFISSIFVIAIHTRPLQNVSTELDFYFVDVVCRMAVPFFCVCSGYYLYNKLQFENGLLIGNKENKKVFSQYTVSTLKLYIIWSIIYLIFQIPNWIEIGWFSIYAFLDWGIAFFLNGSYYHLWYLLCIIYALPVCYFLMKKIRCKRLIILGIILYVIEAMEYAYRVFLPNNIQSVFHIYDRLVCIPISITRILPFLIMGVYIANRGALNLRGSICGFVCTLSVLSYEATKLSGFDIENVSYILSTYVLAFFSFNMVINLNKVINIENSKILANISTGIYCIHPLVIMLVQKSFKWTKGLTLFVVVSVISIILVYGFYVFKKTKRV